MPGKRANKMLGVLLLAVIPFGLFATVDINHIGSDDIADGAASYLVDGDSNADVILVINALDCSAVTTASVEWDSGALTVTSDEGCLMVGAKVDLWLKAGATGAWKTLAVTLSDSSAGESVGMALKDVETAGTITEYGVSIGKGVSSQVVQAVAGEATIIVLFVFSNSITVGTPSGFSSEHNSVKSTDVRVVVFFDADRSQDTATLSFSAPVNYLAVVLGINEDN